jgi:hypothetical protein
MQKQKRSEKQNDEVNLTNQSIKEIKFLSVSAQIEICT